VKLACLQSTLRWPGREKLAPAREQLQFALKNFSSLRSGIFGQNQIEGVNTSSYEAGYRRAAARLFLLRTEESGIGQFQGIVMDQPTRTGVGTCTLPPSTAVLSEIGSSTWMSSALAGCEDRMRATRPRSEHRRAARRRGPVALPRKAAATWPPSRVRAGMVPFEHGLSGSVSCCLRHILTASRKLFPSLSSSR